MPDYSKCPACLEYKPHNWNLCKSCLEEYGGVVDGWPDWLQFIINDNKRLRDDSVSEDEHEILVSNSEMDELVTVF